MEKLEDNKMQKNRASAIFCHESREEEEIRLDKFIILFSKQNT
jgi:hypothetical protein